MSIIRSSRRLAVSVLLCSVAGACASAPVREGTGGVLFDGVNPTATRRGYITTDELRTAHATSTLDMIRTLRPEFLRASARAANPLNPVSPSVFVDGTYLGDLSWLSVIPMTEIRQIEFLHPADAHLRFGMRCGCEGGAIAFQMFSPASSR